MAVTNVTIGTDQYPSYASLTEANSYLAADPRYSSAWKAAEDEKKAQYLVLATRKIDTLNFSGEKENSTQSLEFPREGEPFPLAVQNAAILLAGSYAVLPPEHDDPNDPRIKYFKAGTVEYEFFRGVSVDASVLEFGDEILALLSPFISSQESLGVYYRGGRTSSETDNFRRDRRPFE